MYLTVHNRFGRIRKAAFSLVEVLIAIAIVTVMAFGLYGGITFTFAQVEIARQEERATQIMAERMEVVRLLSWDQLVNIANYVPTNFVASYSVQNPTNPPPGSLMYTGTVVVAQPALTETYAPDIRQVQITLRWTSGTASARKARCSPRSLTRGQT